MKFLSKSKDSVILKNNLTYKEGNSRNNKKLLELLLEEQKNFCAYTEKYIMTTDSIDVEHFQSSIKYNDDYYNYYAVLHKVNISWKKDERYKTATFFSSKFFQDAEELKRRVKYEPGYFIFAEVDLNDTEACEFLDFIGVNEPELVMDRMRHCARVKSILSAAHYESKMEYFKEYPHELHFLTCLEAELSIDLSSCY